MKKPVDMGCQGLGAWRSVVNSVVINSHGSTRKYTEYIM